jgi:DNA-binding response OmpR family regulator
MKILVAEDEPILLRIIEARLKRDGHEVIVTKDGREALAKIHELTPDLIIADIMMPFVSGLEIVGAIKKEGSGIPIIILSAMEQEDTVLEAFALGADDYVTKPFSLNELSVRVRKFAMARPTPKS